MANGYYELVESIGEAKADAVRCAAKGQYIRIGKANFELFATILGEKKAHEVIAQLKGLLVYFPLSDERDADRKEQIERQIKALHSKGVSRNEIATLLGVSYSFVAKRLKNNAK